LRNPNLTEDLGYVTPENNSLIDKDKVKKETLVFALEFIYRTSHSSFLFLLIKFYGLRQSFTINKNANFHFHALVRIKNANFFFFLKPACVGLRIQGIFWGEKSIFFSIFREITSNIASKISTHWLFIDSASMNSRAPRNSTLLRSISKGD